MCLQKPGRLGRLLVLGSWCSLSCDSPAHSTVLCQPLEVQPQGHLPVSRTPGCCCQDRGGGSGPLTPPYLVLGPSAMPSV